MKKSKIIVPALGILAFSTAAAVTGTVAWFTANRLATVSNKNITVVNPEAGLHVKATNVANTKVEYDGTETGHINSPSIIHANDGTNQGYLRDASVQMGASPVVYKSVLGEDGTVSSYATQAIGTADTKTYDGSALYFATQYKLDFYVDRVDTGYETALFFDANASQVQYDSAAVTSSLNKVYKSVRFGFLCGSNWFVWAPLTDNTASETATTPAADTDYAIRNVTGAGTAAANANVADVDAAHRIIGNATASATSNDLKDDTGLVPAANKKVSASYGYLGALNLEASKLTVNVYTWFEGTDTACINDNFSAVQALFTSTMNFIYRRAA